MVKSELSTAWYEMMMKKYNTDEEGVRSLSREWRKKAKSHGGAFKDPEFARQAGLKGVQRRADKKQATNRQTEA